MMATPAMLATMLPCEFTTRENPTGSFDIGVRVFEAHNPLSCRAMILFREQRSNGMQISGRVADSMALARRVAQILQLLPETAIPAVAGLAAAESAAPADLAPSVMAPS